MKRKLGKYELGRTIGEGTFAKVKFAQNTETGENVAVKILAKSTILKHRMVEQVLKYTSFRLNSRVYASSILQTLFFFFFFFWF